MSQQDHETFVSFLRPIAALGLRVVALLSDKQRGLAPTAPLVCAEAKHAFCQAHYLNNVAEPVAEADQSLKVSLRQEVRRETGYLAGASSGCGLD
ncbi:MAG: hypothetical protein IAE79_15220 [Anaerolinea sp.]|nr:hypothetical protein [Anaerolinea sp.]